MRAILRALLADLGINDVSEAADGGRAFALLPVARPDFVVTDLAMARSTASRLPASCRNSPESPNPFLPRHHGERPYRARAHHRGARRGRDRVHRQADHGAKPFLKDLAGHRPAEAFRARTPAISDPIAAPERRFPCGPLAAPGGRRAQCRDRLKRRVYRSLSTLLNTDRRFFWRFSCSKSAASSSFSQWCSGASSSRAARSGPSSKRCRTR